MEGGGDRQHVLRLHGQDHGACVGAGVCTAHRVRAVRGGSVKKDIIKLEAIVKVYLEV